MPDPTDYHVRQVEEAPPWLRREMGEAWFTTVGLLKYAYLELAKRAVMARFPDSCPSDGLEKLAEALQVDRAYGADDDVFRTQLARAWEAWSHAGERQGMINAFQAAGYPNVTIYEKYEWPVEPYPARWWRFWVVLHPPFPWPRATRKWGDGWKWQRDGYKWNGGPSRHEQQRLQHLVNKWRPAHARCESIILVYTGSLWGEQGGTWGDPIAWGGNATYLGV